MLEWLFGKKKHGNELEGVKEATQKSFDSVKNDINSITVWIKHLKNEDEKRDFRLIQIEEKLSTIETDLEGLKNSFAFMEGSIARRLFKQQPRLFAKQTAVDGVGEAVGTAVQTAEPQVKLDGKGIFENLTTMERATVYVLLNSDMKLSYDDLAAMLGKSRATLRGQINTIKQKSEGLIEEVIEANGKKRVYIPEEIKEIVRKTGKVKVRGKREIKANLDN
jgi:chromosome segregation and condensation protein ScpB